MDLNRLRELLANTELAYDLMDELYAEEATELRDGWWRYEDSALPRIDRELGHLKELLRQKEQQLRLDGRQHTELPWRKA